MMNDEGSFPRLVELLQLPRKDEKFEPGLHRLLMDLFYEMSRIQRVKVEDLGEFASPELESGECANTWLMRGAASRDYDL